ncbi:polysaccharide biosynthesis/export family protein [Rhodopila sp.]|uniref:polysaccharide biosynthesis/export family protein n=1 Tax=Rhodopila sp. TaxID=2480087 RepID=UPI003D0C778B
MDHLPRRALPWLTLLSALALAGCAALPASGPEERDILKSARTEANQLGFRIVDVDANTTAALARDNGSEFATIGAMSAPGRVDEIGPGDVLSISVFEIGSGLFAGTGAAAAQAQPGSAGISTSATRENLPPIEVGLNGFISFPYVGRVRAAGRTATELQDELVSGLRSHSQDPQVVVEIRRNVFNTIVVSGEVHKPGPVPLTLAREHLLDAIALSGGPTHPPQDMVVDLIRHGRMTEASLEQVQQDMALNVPMRPQDRVQLIYRPRSFTLMGATKVAELPFTADRVSLAEALARAGGPLDERADPNAVFLFRYEPPSIARQVGVVSDAPRVPIIYHLDMMNTNSYFLAQRFAMRDKDLIYIANARTSQIGKFLGLISGLFTPAIVARTVQQ